MPKHKALAGCRRPGLFFATVRAARRCWLLAWVAGSPRCGDRGEPGPSVPIRRNRKGRCAHLSGSEMFGSRQPHLNFRRSLEDFRLRQVDLALQFPPLHYSRCSSRKKVACAPPGMAIQDVPFKRAVRARMPPHVEEPPRSPPPILVRLSPERSFQTGKGPPPRLWGRGPRGLAAGARPH